MRKCRIDHCTTSAAPRRTLCHKHRTRLNRYDDPDFTQWTVADDVDVRLLIEQQRVPKGVTCLERRLVAVGLSERGMSAERVAGVVGVAPRTVHRWRAQHRTQTAA
ncbi:helix-turn-helix domain-containing protein [Streptomyces sp. NPDC048611]|uniref:helix-turn-helix domain-containing protein n=1 Tax=Streptomyces sp. NPDC048611 TaxID=3155635 RepID=UPI0034291DB4